MPIGFVGSLVTLARVALHARHQVVVGLGFDFDDVPFEVQPEWRVRDGQFAHLLALREDRQTAALVVEVLELDGLQCALAQSVVEQQAQGDPVA